VRQEAARFARGVERGRPGVTGSTAGRRFTPDGHHASDRHAGREEISVNVPDSITADQLDPEVVAELRTLPGDLAGAIARLLVATSAADDPEQAYRYAKQARSLAARVGVVRETCAIAAYQAGDWSGALAEFRAARRMTGRASYLPLMADCERALGRLDRALDIVNGPDARAADQQTQIELRIVESGIRRDQGLYEAAVVALHGPELEGQRIRPEYARLYYAYADALLQVGCEDEAHDWFGRAARADVDGETDAAERFEDLDDFDFEDLDSTGQENGHLDDPDVVSVDVIALDEDDPDDSDPDGEPDDDSTTDTDLSS
jgi:tetratricopeptide (TPR) repeat protein